MTCINREAKQMKKIYILILLLPFSNLAFASDPTFLMTGLVAVTLAGAILSLVFVFAMTKNLGNRKVKVLFRILSVTVLISPVVAGNGANIWPAIIVFFIGDTREIAYSMISILISTCIIYLLMLSIGRKGG